MLILNLITVLLAAGGGGGRYGGGKDGKDTKPREILFDLYI